METTLEFLRKRHSVRSFSTERVSPEILKSLNAELTMINTHEAGMHFTIVADNDEPFKGFSKSYGVFRNVRYYMAAVVDDSFPDARERAGYFAQQFVMKAVGLGLGTCYVGGTYDPRKVEVQLRPDWRILFVVAFGHPLGEERILTKIMTRFIHRHDRDARDFFEGDEQSYQEALKLYPWLHEALEGVACAPSSLNRQPVRINLKEIEGIPRLTAGVDPTNPKNLTDLGIAKYNFGVLAPGVWEWGNNSMFLSGDE